MSATGTIRDDGTRALTLGSAGVIALAAATVLLILTLLLLVLAAGSAQAACTYGGTGNWDINNGETCTQTGGTITVTGDLTVHPGGSLTLNGVTLQMAGTSDGQRTIQVGGTLNIRQSSTVTASNTAFEYKFVVDGTLDVKDSTIRECGYDSTADDTLGLLVRSNSVTISTSTFRDNYAGIHIRATSPKIDNTTFTNNRFGIMMTAGATPSIIDTDVLSNGDGIYSKDSTPTITSTRVEDNSEDGIYLLRSDAVIKGNSIKGNIYGIAIFSSSPSITGNNNISHNRDGIRAFFGDPVIDGNQMVDNDRYAAYLAQTGGKVKDNLILGPLDYSPYIGYGILLHGSTTSITGNEIRHVNLTALTVEAGSDADIKDNDILYTDAYSVWIVASGVRLEGNNLSHSYYAVSFTTCTGTMKDNVFLNNSIAVDGAYVNKSMFIGGNQFIRNQRRGLSLYESHPIIQGNTFDSNPRGIRTYNSGPRIIGNTFINNSFGIDISDFSHIYFADNLVMHGNYTVFASRSTATLVNNTIKFSANYSIYFSNGSYGKLIDNTILGNDRRGVYFMESDGWLINNTFSDSGVGVYAVKAEVTFENNTFHDTEVAIFLDAVEATLSGDDITNNSVFAMMALHSDLLIEHMTVNNCKDGLSFSDSTVIIRDSTISHGSMGMSAIAGSEVIANRLTLTDNEDRAIYLAASRLTIANSELMDNTDGLESVGSPVTIRSSTIKGGERGIFIEDTTLTVQDCTIIAVNGSGIHAFNVIMTVEGSTILGNRNGMDLEEVIVDVQDCEVLDNVDMGIMVNDTDITVRDTRFIGNMDGLFDLGGSTIRIVDCNMSSNEVYGLYTDDSTVFSDIMITRRIVLQDNSILMRGQLTVTDGGELHLLRAPLVFYSIDAGDAGAIIETGGKMYVTETLLYAHFKDIGYYFTAEKGSGLTIVNSTIRHCGRGLTADDDGFLIMTQYTDITKTLFENNSVGLFVMATSFKGYDLRFKDNRIAIKAQEGQVDLFNSTISSSTERDILLTFSTANLLNTKITFAKAEVKDESSLLVVSWYLHVEVIWKDGQPVDGADVTIKDKAGKTMVVHVDDQGKYRWLVVREYQQKGPEPTGYFLFAPININATMNGISVERSEYIAASTLLTLTLIDDSPPAIDITTPADGSILYTSDILVTGTASDLGSQVVAIEVSIDGVTWVPAVGTSSWYANITAPEGNHTLMAKAIDARNNVRTVSIVLEVDLTSPMLDIYSPDDGTVTNRTSIVVKGRVHVGSGLIINDVVVTVLNNGTFSYTVNLAEGANTVHVKTVKGLETMEAGLTVFRDTTPPVISLKYPGPNALVNRSMMTVTVAADEEATFIIAGRPVEAFGGEADMMLELVEGPNYINVRATDRAGNSDESTFLVILDVTRPDILIEKPNTPVFSTEKARQLIVGRTEPGANVTVDGVGVEVGPDGNFTFKTKLRLGRNTIHVVARDKANNTNEIILEIKRKAVEDYSNYIWLAILATVIGLCSNLGILIFFQRYYRPGKKEEGKDVEEDEEEDLEEEGAEEDEDAGEDDRVRPKRPSPVEEPPRDGAEFEELPIEEF